MPPCYNSLKEKVFPLRFLVKTRHYVCQDNSPLANCTADILRSTVNKDILNRHDRNVNYSLQILTAIANIGTKQCFLTKQSI
ncbi:hypothetical protein CEXT_572601 [Caerostris extrusa]|uniref:Uncharacterized protein n=1 Tax=Caerostris extrusa TaxID=172846 RepID=A0AAV4P378_CAEEX|nr:hypothetical protein CEXT_572601 [Caerostris extrusa]